MSLGRQAGILWLLVAAANVGIAFAAIGTSSSLAGDARTGLAYVGAASGFAALVALYAGIRLLVRPSRGALLGATVWGVINVVLIGWGLLSGAESLTLAAGVFVVLAAVASFMAWRSAPEPATTT